MKILNKCMAIAGAASLLASTSAFATIAGTGTATITAPYGSSGPFAVTADGQNTTGPNLGNFWTFCLAPVIDFVPGAQYNYSCDTTVIPNQAGSLNYVALGTAWLYSEFRQGNVGDGGTASSENLALQTAIWFLQGDIGSIAGNTAALDLVAAAAAGIGGVGNLENDANGAYGVYAFNLSKSDTGTPGQPLLAVVPEPSTVVAGALLLLPFGMSTLRILRKKQS